jgi:hypothetical protein
MKLLPEARHLLPISAITEVYPRELAVGEVRHGKASERGLQKNGVALLPYAWRLYRGDHTDPAC